MKRRLPALLAALSAAIATPAFAQNDPGKMFMINAVTPGVVSFSGEGTAQFNNSNSTANNFSVGSASQFGVNASAAATADYMVDANALLSLGTGAQLQQTIGTSSSAANTMAASESAAKAATTIANQKTTEEFGQNFADYAAQRGYTTTTTGGVTSIVGATKEDEMKTENQYNANKKSTLDKHTSDAYASTTQTATASSQTAEQGSGIIQGDFKTSNKSTSQIGASAAMSAEAESKANSAADARFGATYDEYKTRFVAIAGSVDGLINTDAEKLKAEAAGVQVGAGGAILTDKSGLEKGTWETTKSAFSDSQFAQTARAAASSGSASSESIATVTVTGVGSIATLNAADTSAFNVDVATRIRGQIMENNATANGSAGGSLNTVSMANQSNSQSASAFMQAFGADTVKLNAIGGVLDSVTVNGRFNVTVDADAVNKAIINVPSLSAP